MPHARRHPAPPHLACFIIVPAAIHSPHTKDSQLEGNIATFRAQQGSCRTPKGTRFRPDEHVLAPHAFKNIGLAQGWPSITTTSHTQRGSCRTPEGTRLHPTLHVSSSYQPSTILKPAQVRRQHRNIPFSTRLMSHAQRRTRHCLTVQVLPPHRRRQPPSSADHHTHAPSICPCAAHSAWGVGVAEDIGVPPCPVHAD